MKKLLGILVLGLLWCNIGFAANEGSGPIKFPPGFEKRFKAYVNHVNNNQDSKFVFAFHPEGANDWQASRSKRIADKRAIKACNKKAKKKGCKIFARGTKIVWNWESIPEIYFTIIDSAEHFDYLSWKDVNVEIGKGPVSLSQDVEKKFQEYLTIYENRKNEKNFSIYFAISKDGKNAGDMEASSADKSIIEEVKAWAIAECMTNSNKVKCYLYAINDKIIWEAASSNSIIIEDDDIVKKLKALNELYKSGALTKEEFEKAKKKLLN